MTLEKSMSSKVVTIQESDTLMHAIRMIKENKIKHLPVVNSAGDLIGLVSDRDLRKASASDATSLEIHELMYLLDKVKLNSIMVRNPITADKNTSAKQAALLMVEKGIGCLPIMEGKQLIGIVTRSDLLRTFATEA